MYKNAILAYDNAKAKRLCFEARIRLAGYLFLYQRFHEMNQMLSLMMADTTKETLETVVSIPIIREKRES
jgi:hypothetical protein